MDSMIDGFLAYITGVRRYSERTRRSYHDVLENFSRYAARELEDEGGDPAVRGMDSQVLRGYEIYLLKEKKLGARSVGMYLSVLSSFATFLMKQGVLKSNPVRTASRPKVSKRLPDFYRKESMDEYFAQSRPYGERTVLDLLAPGEAGAVYGHCVRRLIVSILYSTGIRRSELIALNREDFDRERMVLHVHGKGDKMRDIPLTASLCGEILLYLEVVRKTGLETQDAALLLTPTGRRTYAAFVDKAVKTELGSVASITARKSPHVLRHTIATELLDDGADINSIKEMLGHSSLAATQVYTHNSIEKLKKVYNQAHPRCQSSKKQ